MAPWLQYLLAVIVFAHGFIYVGPLSPVRGFTAWTGRSWLLGGVLTGDSLRVLAWSLHILTAVATIGCAASIAFASMVPGWWRPLAIASGVAGLLAFLVLWVGMDDRSSPSSQGVIGAIVSVMLLITAILYPRAFD